MRSICSVVVVVWEVAELRFSSFPLFQYRSFICCCEANWSPKSNRWISTKRTIRPTNKSSSNVYICGCLGSAGNVLNWQVYWRLLELLYASFRGLFADFWGDGIRLRCWGCRYSFNWCVTDMKVKNFLSILIWLLVGRFVWVTLKWSKMLHSLYVFVILLFYMFVARVHFIEYVDEHFIYRCKIHFCIMLLKFCFIRLRSVSNQIFEQILPELKWLAWKRFQEFLLSSFVAIFAKRIEIFASWRRPSSLL